ncbi:hypothetical protein E2C01_058414 [Portunus trituberculatus]|uniref:Uncharacterized protein n=1 Tax=Portunus trituberculatus TaxID=210409 RepID=A0A5B7GZS0_PORTR|nr:hypothetical protein [Portunus trituberculatus]
MGGEVEVLRIYVRFMRQRSSLSIPASTFLTLPVAPRCRRHLSTPPYYLCHRPARRCHLLHLTCCRHVKDLPAQGYMLPEEDQGKGHVFDSAHCITAICPAPRQHSHPIPGHASVPPS